MASGPHLSWLFKEWLWHQKMYFSILVLPYTSYLRVLLRAHPTTLKYFSRGFYEEQMEEHSF